MPSCCTSLPSSLLRFLPSLATDTDAQQYRDLHLLWPSFNLQAMSLSGKCPLLCTRGGDPSSQGPCLFPPQPKESCWLQGNSSSVGGRTMFQGARAAQAFGFASITQHHISDKGIAVSEQQEMSKTCWIPEELDPALLQLQSSLNTAPGSAFWGLVWQNRVAHV